jgi:hypothetical protein
VISVGSFLLKTLHVWTQSGHGLPIFSGKDEAADRVMFSCVGRTIALASQHGKEGVLEGPHSVVPFLPIGREWLHFVDRRHQLTISEHRISRRTNDSSFKAAKPEAALGWLETDRRAHCNPTRMASIRRTSRQKLWFGDGVAGFSGAWLHSLRLQRATPPPGSAAGRRSWPMSLLQTLKA